SRPDLAPINSPAWKYSLFQLAVGFDELGASAAGRQLRRRAISAPLPEVVAREISSASNPQRLLALAQDKKIAWDTAAVAELYEAALRLMMRGKDADPTLVAKTAEEAIVKAFVRLGAPERAGRLLQDVISNLELRRLDAGQRKEISATLLTGAKLLEDVGSPSLAGLIRQTSLRFIWPLIVQELN